MDKLFELYEAEKQREEELSVSYFRPKNSLSYIDSEKHAIVAIYDKETNAVNELYYKDDVYGRGNGDAITNKSFEVPAALRPTLDYLFDEMEKGKSADKTSNEKEEVSADEQELDDDYEMEM